MSLGHLSHVNANRLRIHEVVDQIEQRQPLELLRRILWRRNLPGLQLILTKLPRPANPRLQLIVVPDVFCLDHHLLAIPRFLWQDLVSTNGLTVNGFYLKGINMMRFSFGLLLSVTLLFGIIAAADQDPDMKQFQGKWEVVGLVEDGKVIPKEAIREWLPSGGQFEIAENAIMFVSPDDGKKHVKLFSLDATQFPKGIDLSTRDKKDGAGIYRFDNGQLIVCFSDPNESRRPTEFSAREGSNNVLMTLQRMGKQSAPQPAPARQEPTGATAKVLTDAQVKELLKGTWRYADKLGSLIVTFTPEGTFSTVREVKEIRVFQKVFVQSPISTGKWSLQNGTLTFHIQTSVHPDRVNKLFDFSVRSISEKDFIFVDYMGRVGQASRIR